jgi:hypothetical protein
MSHPSIVCAAMNNEWLEEQGVPDMNALPRQRHPPGEA